MYTYEHELQIQLGIREIVVYLDTVCNLAKVAFKLVERCKYEQ